MSKKLQQTLTGAMAAMMATGVVATPVMAATTTTTDVDAIYKAAYTATMKALTDRTQAAVNEARTAIKALPANLESAIGEFSKQVDTVQHPILVNIIAAIKTAETTPNQANVNAAKKAIPAELVPQWKNSYSSAVDKIQQDLITKAVEAVKLAETNKTEENLKVAKELVADLLTADSEGIRNAVKPLEVRVDAIKIYALTVAKVNSIDRYQVEVEFETLTDSLKNITVEVVDGKGKVHQVSTKSLLKGAKSTKFDFTSLVGVSELKGVWTVNGVKYDVTEATLVKEVLNNLDNDEDFAEALANLQDEEYIDGVLGKYNRQDVFEFDKITNANDQNGGKYIAALKTKKTEIKNASDVQAVIDTVNAELAGEVTVEKLIELSKDGSVTAKQFFTAMTNVSLEKVNEDWASNYKTSIATLNNNSKLKDVQEAIYTTNKAKVTTQASADITPNINPTMDAGNIKVARTKAEAKLNLVEAYYKEDAEKVTEKADLIKAVKVQLAILDLKAVTDVTDLNAALKNLSEVVNNEDKFSYAKEINENIVQEYFDGIKVADIESVLEATTIAEVKDFAQAIQVKVFADEIVKIGNLDNSNKLYEILTSKKLGLKNVTDANKAAYVADIAKFVGTTYDDVQATVDAVNARIAMTKATTKAGMRTALVTLVEESGSPVLDAKTTAQIDDLAEEFLSLRDKKDASKIELNDIDTTLGASFTSVDDSIDTKLNAVNDLGSTVTKAELEAIVGENKIAAGMIADFIKVSNKDHKEAAADKYTYENYTQIRKALGL